jgi:flagellar hook-associated protein 1 FlgK
MGLLNSALNIGRSALLSYQGALQTVGNNISSAGSPDYTRLTPQLDPVQGMLLGRDLQPGAGVALTDIRRMIDEALEGRVRLATGNEQEAGVRQTALAQVESFFDDLSGAGLGARLTEFWTLFDELQNTPEDPALRDLVLSGGSLLADSMRSLRGELIRLGEDLDSQIEQVVDRADEIAGQIAQLNREITTAEAGRRSQATGLRDQRDGLLRELSELMDVTVREQPDGSINIYIGGETLVQANTSRGLTAVTQTDGEFVRTSARFADTNQQVQVRSGQLAGLLTAREQDAYGRIAALDELAAGVIADVNRVHADGQGLAGFRSVTGTNDLLATSLPLNLPAAGLSLAPQTGSFYVTVIDDATQTPVAYRIAVDLDGAGAADTTLDSLVASFNGQVSGVVASVTTDGRIAFTADAGYSFVFGYDGQQSRADTSGVLAALGVNTFFSGTSAANIQVNDTLRDNPNLIAAASVFLSGDGANASRLAALSEQVSRSLGNISLNDFYNSISNSAAVSAAGANASLEAASSVLSSLQAQKESVSGVNLDEEAISLLKYERSFQGAARFVSAVDEMLGELVTLIR